MLGFRIGIQLKSLVSWSQTASFQPDLWDQQYCSIVRCSSTGFLAESSWSSVCRLKKRQICILPNPRCCFLMQCGLMERARSADFRAADEMLNIAHLSAGCICSCIGARQCVSDAAEIAVPEVSASLLRKPCILQIS